MRNKFFSFVQFACIITILSCNLKHYIIEEKIKCDNCNNYKSYIQNNWKIDSTHVYFFVNPPNCEEFIHGKTGVSYTMIVGRKCLIGIHVDSIIKLFGAPTMEFSNRLDYYMTVQCQGKSQGDSPNIPGCIRLQVYFGKNRKVIGVSGMTRE